MDETGKQARNIKTLLPKASSLVKSTAKIIRNNVGFVSIFGPSAEEIGTLSADLRVKLRDQYPYHEFTVLTVTVLACDGIIKDIELQDKTCLITGANSGIGLEMTRCLSAKDCNVLMACRNTYAASVVIKNVCENPHRLKLCGVNLASLKSVKNFTDQICNEQKNIDMVILNAGVFGIPWSLTEDDLETTFQVNFLSQLYLIMNIEEILAPDARVVFLSSESHRHVDWPVEKRLVPTEEQLSIPKHEYTSIKAFNVSKLCGVLAMHYLNCRWLDTGRGVFAAHPGSFVNTRLSRNWWPYELLYFAMQPFAKSISQAASTPLYCATSPELAGMSAAYVNNCKRCPESEMASDFHLALRVVELAQGMLRERTRAFEPELEPQPAPAPAHTLPDKLPKEPIEDEQNLISNYSG